MSRYVLNMTWNDAVHLSEADKAELLASYSPHERDARSKGIPSLGAGALFPIPEDDYVINADFIIPDKWPRVCGLDVGWEKTACVWGAYEAKADCWYIDSEYYRGHAEPSVHADAIKARGSWIPCLIDCHSNSRGQSGTLEMSVLYANLGIDVQLAQNHAKTLEPSILDMYQRLSSGRLKIMKHCQNLIAEIRIARRDANGKIVDKHNHAIDATRFILMSGTQIMEKPPVDEFEFNAPRSQQGKNSVTGY